MMSRASNQPPLEKEGEQDINIAYLGRLLLQQNLVHPDKCVTSVKALWNFKV